MSAQRPVEYHLGREATPHCTPHCAQTPWYWFIITTVDLSDFDRTASAHQQSQGVAELEFTIDGTHGFDRMTTPLPPGLEVTVHVNVTTGYEYLEGPDVYLEPFTCLPLLLYRSLKPKVDISLRLTALVAPPTRLSHSLSQKARTCRTSPWSRMNAR